jgi:2-polyprenyl-3-methyl-5-hydroxy-6-metoxy-1,4-benzoquinol methylase
MGMGSAVRQRLGGLEAPAIDLYRSVFISLEDFAASAASLGPAARILEIGAGDGVCGQRLTEAFPEAEYLGIDIAPVSGGMFRGDASRAVFRSVSTTDLIKEGPRPFDLVVIVDVIHHVPAAARQQLLEDAAELTADNGTILVKDWERDAGRLAHGLVYTADRYVSGDRTVDFASRRELRAIIDAGLPDFSPVFEGRVPPLRGNVLYGLRRTGRS